MSLFVNSTRFEAFCKKIFSFSNLEFVDLGPSPQCPYGTALLITALSKKRIKINTCPSWMDMANRTGIEIKRFGPVLTLDHDLGFDSTPRAADNIDSATVKASDLDEARSKC
ncbi:hypothetical protein EVAR_95155_1 [Eumeta japonica]|uniref:Uncharacterized protein n=1 Tax=Eumeta variegata TaxID=151549 RepID=A0A4C1VHF0_EUMVA|nr:hypothetical protein EVAR_95155_1 [Eumeta japonica]